MATSETTPYFIIDSEQAHARVFFTMGGPFSPNKPAAFGTLETKRS